MLINTYTHLWSWVTTVFKYSYALKIPTWIQPKCSKLVKCSMHLYTWNIKTLLKQTFHKANICNIDYEGSVSGTFHCYSKVGWKPDVSSVEKFRQCSIGNFDMFVYFHILVVQLLLMSSVSKHNLMSQSLSSFSSWSW